ncbi:src-like-adapter 2 [Chanos chanos]|uniref:Src-like-adapter 2 n=1 Tax=Chanos chanos TaxID=29144 RepID=A0A6J2VPZ6_CHACN|nr:src-like-adapter 2 [Chanos chanos]
MGILSSKGRRQSTTHTSENPAEPDSPDNISGNNNYVVIALCDYSPNGHTDQKICMGERLNILSEEGDILRVSSTTTGFESIIPRNNIAKVFNRWQFVGISRKKAEELLLMPQNWPGSFLIRESQSCNGSYSLSVLQSSGTTYFVKHYRINRLLNGWFYILPRLTFSSLSQLVEYYSERADGACCLLREPCFIWGINSVSLDIVPRPIAIRRPTLNWKNLKSSVILRESEMDKEESLVSEGLRETMNSYLYMTEASSYQDIYDKPED